METNSLLTSFDELAATQKVRLFDVYFLGPFLLYASTRKGPLGNWSRRTLFVAGCMTVVYNWKRYRTIEADLKKAAEEYGI